MSCLDDGSVVKDALLNSIEMALYGVLRLLRRRHGVALESLQPAVDPVELDPEFAAKAVNVLAHVMLLLPSRPVRRPLAILGLGLRKIVSCYQLTRIDRNGLHGARSSMQDGQV